MDTITRRERERASVLQPILDDPLKPGNTDYLIFADWLEDHGEVVRAEFIRVQCKLEELREDYRNRPRGGQQVNVNPCQHKYPSMCADCRDLQKRSINLLAVNENDWRQRDWALGKERWNDPDDVEWLIKIAYHCGLVHYVKLTMGDFVGTAEYLFTHHPITRVLITDLEPIQIDGGWHWMKNQPEPQSPWFVPEVIWNLIDLPTVGGFDNVKISATLEACLDALWTACVHYGRNLVGLPHIVTLSLINLIKEEGVV